jgi:uncharacterized protein
MRLLIAPARSLGGASRSKLRRIGFVLLALVGAALLAAPVAAQTWQTGTDGLLPIPPLTAHVTDLTQTLSAQEKQALEAKLDDWEARTTNQLAVLLVPTTQPEPIEAYAIRVAEKWQIGRKGKDNGALFLVAKDDKKMRIEVGYGLEGVLTDATSRRIIAESVAPLFREGKFAAGIDAGVDRIISTVAEGKPLPPREASNVNVKPSGRHFDFGTMLLILFIIVPIVGSVLRSIFGRLLGSTVGAGIVGTAAWFVAGSLLIAGIAAIVGFLVMIFAGAASTMAGRRGGVFLPGGFGGGFGGGGGIGGGGGWSGGGGTFGGGGASGGWD